MKKLKNRKGETIAETLVALTIAAIGLVLLASMIQSSSNMIRTSNEQVKRYVAEENRLAVQLAYRGSDNHDGENPGGEAGEGGTETDGSFGMVQIDVTGVGVKKLTDDSKDNGIQVRYFVNTQAQGETVEMYNKAIVSYKPDDGEEDIKNGEGGGGSGT